MEALRDSRWQPLPWWLPGGCQLHGWVKKGRWGGGWWCCCCQIPHVQQLPQWVGCLGSSTHMPAWRAARGGRAGGGGGCVQWAPNTGAGTRLRRGAIAPPFLGRCVALDVWGRARLPRLDAVALQHADSPAPNENALAVHLIGAHAQGPGGWGGGQRVAAGRPRHALSCGRRKGRSQLLEGTRGAVLSRANRPVLAGSWVALPLLLLPGLLAWRGRS